MDLQDCKKLREHYVELVRNLIPEDLTDYLFQYHILSEEDCEKIRSGPTRAQRVRIFLGILPKKNSTSMEKLIEAMKHAGYTELAAMLEAPLESEDVVVSPTSQSPPESPCVDDPHLISLKERLEQQSEVVSSMQAEMEMLQEELKRQSQTFETNAKYKQTVTVLGELEKEKAERQKVYDEVYETLLKDINKLEEDRTYSRTSSVKNSAAVRTPSFTLSGGIRHYAKIKCVLIGDGGTGKTSIIHYFMHRRRNESYIPTIFDNRSVEVMHGNTLTTVNFWDTAGQDAYDKLRPLSYSDAHVALLVFSVTSQTTLNNVMAKWHPEFRHYCRKVPFLLVGNKTDPMQDQKKLHEMRKKGERFVEAKEGDKAAEMLRAAKKKAFLCSAHDGKGIQALLDALVAIGLKNMHKSHKSQTCACM
ncbi:uncharacterized protein [Watersipora subatra]|uniref:uncharacterized protein n=1 Tax=Watersipora subatra TaxID=2589382 RepID=UPI00355B1C58